MENSKKIKNYLKIIRKKGDLYDVICKKRNAIPDTITIKTVKVNALIFSRLVYLALVLTRRLINSFAPIKKVKNASYEIRKSVGVPIDIIRTKDSQKKLALLYSDYSEFDSYPSLENLIKSLKDITSFCMTYDIQNIYIKKSFLSAYLDESILENFYETSQDKLLNHAFYPYTYKLIKTNKDKLSNIINELENSKYDRRYIFKIGEKISDRIIQDALEKFKSNNRIEELKFTVKNRLNTLINSDGIKKDRVYKKINESYELADIYVKKICKDKDKNLISKSILDLYSLLEVTSFSHLEKIAAYEVNNQEINLIALLYLYLLGEKEKQHFGQIKSIYDYIYECYKDAPFYKRIPWVNTLLEKRCSERAQYLAAIIITIASYIWSFIPLFFVDFIDSENSFLNKYNSIYKKTQKTYEKSYNLEKNMLQRVKQLFENVFPKKIEEEILDYSKKQNGEESAQNYIVGEIEWFKDDVRPLYFVDKYAYAIHFYRGKPDFNFISLSVNKYNVVETEPLFQIKTPFSKNLDTELSIFSIPLELCPVGDNYVMTNMYVKDAMDETKYIELVPKEIYHLDLSDEEKELINSMEKPMAYYVYGLGEQIDTQMDETTKFYTNIYSYEIKNAIIEGLNLESDASRDEINQKIAEKSYTKYPLDNINYDDEYEFFKEIAALDSIDIELASVLTTGANTYSCYVNGFKNSNNDSYITTNEGYVWVIDENGDIIDFLEKLSSKSSQNTTQETKNMSYLNKEYTNYKNNLEYEEKNEETNSTEKENQIKEILKKVFLFAKKYNIPYYTAGIIALLIVKKLFGEKIKLNIKIKTTSKILNDENMAETYVNLMKFIYGEDSIPIARTKEEWVDTIFKEFYAFNNEKIDELIKEIKTTLKTSEEKASLKKVEELLRIIPFVKENGEEIIKYHPKRLILKNKE